MHVCNLIVLLVIYRGHDFCFSLNRPPEISVMDLYADHAFLIFVCGLFRFYGRRKTTHIMLGQAIKGLMPKSYVRRARGKPGMMQQPQFLCRRSRTHNHAIGGFFQRVSGRGRLFAALSESDLCSVCFDEARLSRGLCHGTILEILEAQLAQTGTICAAYACVSVTKVFSRKYINGGLHRPGIVTLCRFFFASQGGKEPTKAV